MKITIEMDQYDKTGDLVEDCPIIITDASRAGDDMIQLAFGDNALVVDSKELMEALSKFV